MKISQNLGYTLYEYFNDKTSSEEVLSKVELKGKVGVKGVSAKQILFIPNIFVK